MDSFFREWCRFINLSSHYVCINPNAFLETDINLNPLRTILFENELNIEDGKVNLK